jgi:hypothetical protein
MNFMDFKEFIEEAKAVIGDYLPDEYRGAEINVKEIGKLNESYTGMTVAVEGEQIAITLNLNAYFEMYQDGMPMDEVLDEMADTIQDNRPVMRPSFNAQAFQDYSYVKDKLFIRLSGADSNEEVLKNMPHKVVEDMAITYHILAENAGDSMASIPVTEGLLERYGVSAEQLHTDALESSGKLFPLKMDSMDNIMRTMFEKEMKAEGLSAEEIENMLQFMPEQSTMIPMIILTNENQMHGAATLFYPDAMKQISEQLEGNYFILPSSVHECILIPDDGEISAVELREMVTTINANEVAPKDRLTDQAYHYDCEEAVFEKAEAYEDRMASRAEEIKKPEKSSVLKKLDQKRQEAVEKAVHPAPGKATPELAM